MWSGFCRVAKQVALSFVIARLISTSGFREKEIEKIPTVTRVCTWSIWMPAAFHEISVIPEKVGDSTSA
jgi:hypothetical protein